jgi:hypothetical protein
VHGLLQGENFFTNLILKRPRGQKYAICSKEKIKKIKDVGEDNLCDLPYSMHAFYGRHGGGLLIALIYIDKII